LGFRKNDKGGQGRSRGGAGNGKGDALMFGGWSLVVWRSTEISDPFGTSSGEEQSVGGEKFPGRKKFGGQEFQGKSRGGSEGPDVCVVTNHQGVRGKIENALKVKIWEGRPGHGRKGA